MLVSRGVCLMRAYNLLKHTPTQQLSVNAARNAHHAWNYRVATKPSKGIENAAELVMGIAWWWILWHLWTEPGHVFGEFPYPDARKWTDEELGVPN